MAVEPSAVDPPRPAAEAEDQHEAHERLREQVLQLEQRVRRAEERRRALLHIMGDLNETNKRLADQRRAMLHILVDYEADRSRLAKQTARLDGSRRALIHILQDSHESNLRLERSRKAMIHIMDDLRETTHEMERREQELREKQEQLVQAGKLATLGELTTGVAHELNNPLNNIGLFITNAIDRIELGAVEEGEIRNDLIEALDQVRKATEIITHLRTFGRAAAVTFAPVLLDEVIERSLSLTQEQLRLRQIEVVLDIYPGVVVEGNPIQLEQVFINLLTNSRDALTDAPERTIRITCETGPATAVVTFADTGPGIPAGLEQRIFDPFFTTKEVGTGTGLGLSITYGIIQEHGGTISVESSPGEGARFAIELPLATEARGRENGA
jgi:C4-dicarboxylate-specific signal transduction histidine kinase